MGIPEQDASHAWAVHRQDDTGNRFVVRTELGREEAASLAAALEARGHKQLYRVEAEPTAAERPGVRPRDA